MSASGFNKNFIRDLKLPIAVNKEPYFSHFLNLINPYYDSINKYNIFVDSFEKNGQEKFFENNKAITNGLLDYLKNKNLIINKINDDFFNKISEDFLIFDSNKGLNIKSENSNTLKYNIEILHYL